MERAVAALGALAQETRLAVFRLLVRVGPKGLAAGEIARRIDLPAATLSFHLSQLSHAGLIKAARNGRSIRYSANYESMGSLMGFLQDNCCEEAHPVRARARRGASAGEHR